MNNDEQADSIEEFEVSGELCIETPTAADMEELARRLVHAGALVAQCAGSRLDGSLKDLERIQAVLDSNTVEPEATYSIESLGVAFGVVFVNHNPGFDWCIVEDDWGRTSAIRYNATPALIFPVDMITKRLEAQEMFDVSKLYGGLCAHLGEIIGDEDDA